MVTACAEITAGTLCRDLVIDAETINNSTTSSQATSECMCVQELII